MMGSLRFPFFYFKRRFLRSEEKMTNVFEFKDKPHG